MRSKTKAKLAIVAAAITSGFFATERSAMAATDTWSVLNSGNASGSWNVAGNWTPAAVPAAADTALFSTQDITSTSTVVLGANESITALTFGDTNTTSSAGWVLNSDASNANGANTLTLNGAGFFNVTVNQLGAGSVATINADISDGNATGNGLAKFGVGTLVLTANNSALTGTTAINNGTLELDFNHAWSPTSDIIGDTATGSASASHLQLQGGTLLLNGGTGKTNAQNFSGGTATELGDSSIVLNQNGAASLSVNLGALTHNWASSLDFQLPTTGTVSMTFGAAGGAYPSETFGTAAGTDGLLVDSAGMAFATVNNGADWAAVNGSDDIVPGSTVAGFYTPTTTSTLAGNADAVTNVTLAASAANSSTRFNGASSTINIGGNTLSTAGILMTSAASGNMVIQNGTLTTPATNELFVDQSSPTNTLTISANITGGVDLLKSGAGALVLSGTNTYTGWNYLNSGTVSITGGSVGAADTATSGTAGDTYVGQAFGNSATLNISAGTLTSGRTVMGGNPGNYAGGNGTINQTGGTINSNYWFSVGTFGSGTYNMSGGILNTNPAGFGVSELEIGVFSSGSGTVNLSGTGQINIDYNGTIAFGDAGSTQTGTFNQNGGTVTFYSDSGTTVGGGGGVVIGGGGTGVFTYNLNAGILTTPSVSHGSGTGVFNFNGGTLRAAETNTGFMAGLTSANVEAGGAIIDTNGNNVSVSQPLIHAASLGATTDGGLTKVGAGTLQVGGASTYSGGTMITAGTLQLPAPGVPVPVARYSFDTPSLTNGVLNPGATVTNSGSGGAALNGSVNVTDWQGAGSGPASGVAIVSGGPYANSHALQFDGLGTSVDVPSQIVNQGSSANWTFSTWVQTTTPGSSIMSKNSGADGWTTGNEVFFLGSNSAANAWNNNGYPTAVRFAGGFIQGTPTNSPPNDADGNWHMITFVDSGGNQSIYTDGVATVINVTGFTGTDISNLTRLGINVDSFFAGDGNVDFAGNMDDLNFFNVALNATQIGQLYANDQVTSSGGGGQFLPVGTPVNITTSGATLDLDGQNQTIGSLAGVAGSAVTLGSGALTTGGNNGSTTFAGAITGSGGLIKQGSGTFTMTGVNGYSGGTTVTAGTLVVGVNGALPTGAVSVTGGTLKLGASTGLATVTSLSVSGSGAFDVNNNHVIINYGSGPDPISSIAALLKTGYNGGTWNGAGIDSSAAAANSASYGLGYADAADAGNPADLASGTIEVKYTLLGDADLNGVVNGVDFGILASNFNKGVTGWDKGDFNYDNVVSGIDFGDLAANFNKGDSGASVGVPAYDDPAIMAFAAANGLLADVPEPASIGLLAVGTVGLMARRRRAVK